MADETFPTLSRGASYLNFREQVDIDPTIRNETEHGLVLTRPRFTALNDGFDFGYEHITAADKVLLKAMQTNVRVGSGTIDWTNPSDSVLYEVRLGAPLQFQVDDEDFNKFNVRIRFVET